MNKQKKEPELEEFEFLIDSRNLTQSERENENKILLKARQKSVKNMSESTIRSGKLLQLFFRMESYLATPEKSSKPMFAEFLTDYIEALYDRQKDFAADLDIKPITLSHVLNQHREPQQIFLRKLVVHSEDVYKEIGYFKKEIWPGIYYQDKLNQFVSMQEQVMEEQKEYVSTKRIGKKKL